MSYLSSSRICVVVKDPFHQMDIHSKLFPGDVRMQNLGIAQAQELPHQV
jgi:hypothetical protein